MADNKTISLQRYAMQFGTYMGIYWIGKFILFPLGLTYQFLFFLFIGLTLAVPFMGYHYARTFRDTICGGRIKFLQAWVFMVFMYLFAALLTAAAHYVYFRYFDDGYIVNKYAQLVDMSLSADMAGLEGYVAQMNEALELIRAMNPIEITMQLLSLNVFYCAILALITAPFVRKAKKN